VWLVAGSAAAVVASGVWSPSIDGIRLAVGDAGKLEIGRARIGTGWLGAAFAQPGEAVLENVTFQIGPVTYRVPRITFAGASLSRAELISLFEGPAALAGQRLARLSAREASAPEIRVEQDVAGVKQTTVYRDVVARDIVGGRVASLVSAGATLEMSGDKGQTVKGTAGQLSLAGLDLAYMAALYAEKAGPQPREARTVYAAFTLDNLVLADPNGAEMRIARMAGKDFKARPTAESWSEAMRIIGEAQDLEKASPAERSRFAGAIIDLFDAFEIGSMEATGFEVRDPSAKDQPVGRIARLAFTGGGAGQVADMRVEGFEIVSNNGTARIGLIAFTGFSFRDTLRGLRDLSEQSLDKVDPADLRKLVPTIGTMRFADLDFDVPNEKSEAAKPDNIRFGVKDIEVTADKPVNGIPTNLRLAIGRLTFRLPEKAAENGLKDLVAMGYRNLDLSFAAAANWNEAGSEVVVREVSLRGADMGSVVLRGVLANVGKDVFSSDSTVALVALVGASARNAHLTVENKGLFERLIAQEAKKQKKSPEDLRREYGMAAAIAVPAMLGNSASAKAIGQAVAKFVAKPGRLIISARTKDPAGLGLADFAATSEPAALLEKLDVTATTE
jgi:hypothetical protein